MKYMVLFVLGFGLSIAGAIYNVHQVICMEALSYARDVEGRHFTECKTGPDRVTLTSDNGRRFIIIYYRKIENTIIFNSDREALGL